MPDKPYSQKPPQAGGLEEPKVPGDLTPEQWAEVMRIDDERDPNEGYDAEEVIQWLKSKRTNNPLPKPKLRRFD